MTDGLGVWLLDAPGGFGDPGFHSHHAIQLTIALTGDVTLETACGTLTGSSAMIAADAPHRMTGAGLIAIVFVDPESSAGRGLAKLFSAGGFVLSLDQQDIHRHLEALCDPLETLSPGSLLEAGQRAVDQLVPPTAPPASDPRVDRIIAHLGNHPDLTLAAAAEAQRVFLSPERLRHLFVEHTGLPHKSWALWRRMTRALGEYAQGRTLTEAAHAAGFSDSAHLSRVFRRQFGLPATTLTRV